MVENEPVKFRRGESTGRPIGGHVSKEPFPQALYKLAASRGYESQSSLSRVLGESSNSSVSNWYLGRRAPSPEYFAAFLRLLKPNDEELEALVEPYRKLLAQWRGNRSSHSNTHITVEHGQKQIKPSNTALGFWLVDYAKEKLITLNTLAERLRIKGSDRDMLSLRTMSDILQRAPEVLGFLMCKQKVWLRLFPKLSKKNYPRGIHLKH